MNADTSWKTVPNLTSKIADKLRDEVERTTNGNVKNFVQALQEAELPEIRKKLKNSSPLSMHLRSKPGKHC